MAAAITATTHVEDTTSATDAKGDERRNVDAIFRYYAGQRGIDSAPTYVDRPETWNQTVLVEQTHTVHDLRGIEDQYTLENAGFQFVKHESAVKLLEDVETLKETLWPETAELVKKITGADLVKPYNLQLRHKENGPVKAVHCDLNENAAYRLRRAFPDETDELLSRYSRFQSIDTWRPLHTVYKDPFAVIDGTSLADDDLVNRDIHNETFTESGFWCCPNERHRWFYLHNQRVDEPLLLKLFDSRKGCEPRFAPHSAFTDTKYEDMGLRKSVEVRVFAFYE